MVDFSKHKHGDVVVVHCCDECARKAGVNSKRPADSGKASWLCDVCGHHGIGSLTDCEIGYMTRTPSSLQRDGISMRNLRGDWVK
jgi:ribosomal protein L37AE/L43A